MLTKIYADSPDYRLLTELVDELRRGAIFIYPTASATLTAVTRFISVPSRRSVA